MTSSSSGHKVRLIYFYLHIKKLNIVMQLNCVHVRFILNMDQNHVIHSMSSKSTIEKKGSKRVVIKTKARVNVFVIITASG